MGRVVGERRQPSDVVHSAALRHGHVTGPCCRAPRRLDVSSRACTSGPRLQHLCLDGDALELGVGLARALVCFHLSRVGSFAFNKTLSWPLACLCRVACMRTTEAATHANHCRRLWKRSFFHLPAKGFEHLALIPPRLVQDEEF